MIAGQPKVNNYTFHSSKEIRFTIHEGETIDGYRDDDVKAMLTSVYNAIVDCSCQTYQRIKVVIRIDLGDKKFSSFDVEKCKYTKKEFFGVGSYDPDQKEITVVLDYDVDKLSEYLIEPVFVWDRGMEEKYIDLEMVDKQQRFSFGKLGLKKVTSKLIPTFLPVDHRWDKPDSMHLGYLFTDVIVPMLNQCRGKRELRKIIENPVIESGAFLTNVDLSAKLKTLNVNRQQEGLTPLQEFFKKGDWRLRCQIFSTSASGSLNLLKQLLQKNVWEKVRIEGFDENWFILRNSELVDLGAKTGDINPIVFAFWRDNRQKLMVHESIKWSLFDEISERYLTQDPSEYLLDFIKNK